MWCACVSDVCSVMIVYGSHCGRRCRENFCADDIVKNLNGSTPICLVSSFNMACLPSFITFFNESEKATGMSFFIIGTFLASFEFPFCAPIFYWKTKTDGLTEWMLSLSTEPPLSADMRSQNLNCEVSSLRGNSTSRLFWSNLKSEVEWSRVPISTVAAPLFHRPRSARWRRPWGCDAMGARRPWGTRPPPSGCAGGCPCIPETDPLPFLQ